MKTGISSYTYAWAVGVPGHEPENPLGIHGLLQNTIDNSLSLVQISDNFPLHLLGDKKLHVKDFSVKFHHVVEGFSSLFVK